MKTNVIMIRRMGDFDVHQRTKDGMFNATLLTKQWNLSRGENKKVNDFFQNDSTAQFIDELVLLKEEESRLLNRGSEGTILAHNTHVKTRGRNGGTWMEPLLFIDFAMWLNPRFKVKVLKFVHDQLIAYRHESGDLTKDLNSSVQIFEDVNYPQLAKGLNHIIYGEHKKDIRNTGTEDQTKRMVDLQKKLAFACDMGFIKSFEGLMKEMRRIWDIKKY